MPRLFSRIAISGLVLLAGSAHAATLIPVPPVPGSIETDIYGINNNNVIVGTYYTSDNVSHGFFGTLDGNYTTFDAPASGTIARAISDDGVVNGVTPGNQCTAFEFQRTTDGTVSPIQRNGSNLQGIVHGFNISDEFVGDYCDGKGVLHGYIGKSGQYKKPVVIGVATKSTEPRGINKLETIDGTYVDSSKVQHGFVLQSGATTTVNYPGATGTTLQGLNDNGIAVGSWFDAKSRLHAFMLDINSSTFTALNVPHSKFAQSFGVNNAGLAAVMSDVGSFVYCPAKKKKCAEIVTPHR